MTTANILCYMKNFKFLRIFGELHLGKNPWYEHPLMIPSREWKALVEDGKEKSKKT